MQNNVQWHIEWLKVSTGTILMKASELSMILVLVVIIDNGIHAHDQYCEIKTIWIDLTDPASQDKIE
jgi:hypothetical protein